MAAALHELRQASVRRSDGVFWILMPLSDTGHGHSTRSARLRKARLWARLTLMFWLFVAVLVVLGEAVHWLKTAEWTSWTCADGLAVLHLNLPSVSWLGVQRIADWSMNLPLALLAVIAGLIFSNAVLQTANLLAGRS